MMWGVALIFLSSIRAEVVSHETIVECHEYYDFPLTSNTTPSFLADLKVNLVTVEGNEMLNISWAVSIDASIEYLEGTLISITGEPSYHCDYNPHLSENITGSQQKWFDFLITATYGFTVIQATNLPIPPFGSDPSREGYKVVTVDIAEPSVTVTSSQITTVTPVGTTASPLTRERVTSTFVGGLSFLMILIVCYIIYKGCGTNIATSLGFKRLPQSTMVPVDVLVVYPAVNSAFQQVVVALAEFLQWHGGCRVAIDMWQQQKIAELGPMRWLAQHAKTADQILIICPQDDLLFSQAPSQPSCSPSNYNFPAPPIPAAARDLFPMILNMVASHAKNTSDLAKFWLVQFDKQQNKMQSTVPLELRACKSFFLMKDLKKLCKGLHTQRQRNKLSQASLRSEISLGEKSTAKLREAIDKKIQKCGDAEKCSHLCLNICNENM